MKRRKFLYATGTSILTASQFNSVGRATTKLNFTVSGTGNITATEFETISVKVTQLEVTPQFIDDNQSARIIASLEVGDSQVQDSISDISLQNGGTWKISNSKKNLELVIDGSTLNSPQSGQVELTIDHDSINKTARKDFVLGDTDPSDVVTDGLIGYWKLDNSVSGTGGTVTDVEDSHQGTTVDNVQTGVTGKIGSAFSFNGGNCVRISDVSELNPSRLSISAWAKYDDLVDEQGSIARKLQAYVLYADNTEKGMQFYNWKNSTRLSTNVKPTIGEWEHWVATNDGNKMKVYRNTELVGELSDTTQSSSSNPLGIGAQATNDSNSGKYGIIGTVDDLRLYNRAITEDEIQKLYELGV